MDEQLRDQSPTAELPKGFECACGSFHRFPAYVYAHWRDELGFKCPGCDREYTIVCGEAWPVVTPDE